MSVVLLPVLAAVAGAVSFTSPCCLPLVPGNLSYMSALPVADLGQRDARAVTVRAAVLFVAGFTAVLGVAVALLGSVVLRNLPLIVRVAGVGIIVGGVCRDQPLGRLRRRRRFPAPRSGSATRRVTTLMARSPGSGR